MVLFLIRHLDLVSEFKSVTKLEPNLVPAHVLTQVYISNRFQVRFHLQFPLNFSLNNFSV